jgi:hypothetical protein
MMQTFQQGFGEAVLFIYKLPKLCSHRLIEIKSYYRSCLPNPKMYNSSRYSDFHSKTYTMKDDNRESKGKVTGIPPITVTFFILHFPMTKKNIADFLSKYTFTT